MSKKSFIRFIASVLLALVVWQQGSMAFFTHSHNIGDKVVVHSHPFSDKSGGRQHSHSTIQFLTIALLSTIAGILGISAIIAGLFCTKKTQYQIFSQRFVPHCILLTPNLRGPPIV